MPTLTIPNTFITGQPAAPNQVNENFTAVQTVVNALDEDNLDSDAVGTDEIQDDAVTNAKIADDAVDTDQIVDDAVTGEKSVLAAKNATGVVADRGSLLFKNGSVVIAAATLSDAITFTGDAFVELPQISVYFDPGDGNKRTRGEGGECSGVEDNFVGGYYLTNIATTGFKIYNLSSGSKTFYWQATGI